MCFHFPLNVNIITQNSGGLVAVKWRCFPTINSIFLAMYDTAEAVVFTRTKKRVPCRVLNKLCFILNVSAEHNDFLAVIVLSLLLIC